MSICFIASGRKLSKKARHLPHIKVFLTEFPDCGHPNDTLNGTLTFTGTKYKAQATYSCEDGFDLTGSQNVSCLSNGIWEQGATCTIKGKIDKNMS